MLLKTFKNILFFQIIVLLFFVFIIGWQAKKFPLYEEDGYNAKVVILDFSKSMGKTTFTGKYGLLVSKLEFSKKLVNELMGTGKVWGLVGFAKSGYYLIPPTKDIYTYNIILSGLSWTQFNQGSNRLEGLKKFVFFSATGDEGIFISDFDYQVDLSLKELDIIKDKFLDKQQKLLFFSLGEDCKGLEKVFGAKCVVLHSYDDYKKFKEKIFVKSQPKDIHWSLYLIPFTIF